MSAFQVVALYDFSTNVESDLPFHAGDVMTVLSTNVGNGWWQARNSEGRIGLVPRSYFKLKTECDSGYNSVQKPPSPHKSSSSSSSSHSICLPPRPPKPARILQLVPLLSPPLMIPSLDERQEILRNSDDHELDTSKSSQEVSQRKCAMSDSYVDDSDDDDDDDDDDYDEEYYRSSRLIGFTTGSADIYLFDTNPAALPDDVAKVSIFDSFEGPAWVVGSSALSCKVGSPRKEKKFHGMKSFISYEITPTTTHVPVCRRYKHFDWLHNQLIGKFSTLVIPPLPSKQISGRFEEEFINNRLRQLELWLARMCTNPIISQSEVFKLFIHCSNFEQWKAGKRQAEKDKYKGAFFFYTVIPPSTILDPISVEIQLDKFGRFIRCMDDSIRHLLGVCQKVAECYKYKFRKEFRRLGKSFDDLAKSFELDTKSSSKKLSSALSYTGKTYSEVGMLFGVQPSRDLDPLLEGMMEYKGILSVFPDILLVQRSTTNKIQETAGQLSRQDVNRIQGRADVITYTVLAEIQHFQLSRVSDFSVLMQDYLKAQIDFFKQVTSKFEQALKHYDGIS